MTRSRWILPLALQVAGCSLVINPDDSLLYPDTGQGSATAQDGSRDGAIVVQDDTATVDDGGITVRDGLVADDNASNDDGVSGPADDVVYLRDEGLAPADAVATRDAAPAMDAVVARDAGPGIDVVVARDAVVGADVVVASPDVVVTGPDVVTAPDVIVSGMCAASCDDRVTCTVDACDPARGVCTHNANDLACGALQQCDLTRGCILNPCRSAAECDDGNACNGAETCFAGTCRAGTAPRCDDGNACNGVETCDPARGCVSPSVGCDDGDVCTADRCTGTTCSHVATDGDHDTYPARLLGTMVCATGTDCDDTRDTVHPGATETCNGRDDNCDGQIDEGLACDPINDTCDDAETLTLGLGYDSLVASGTTADAGSGVEPVCSQRDGGGDVWYRVSWPAGDDLRLETTLTSTSVDTVLVVRTGCDSADLVCNDDAASTSHASRIWVRGTPGATDRRTIVVVVDTFQDGREGPFQLHASISPAVTPTCGNAFDISAGGTVLASGPRAAGMLAGTCGGATGAEDVYRLAGPAGNYSLTAGLINAGRTPVTLYGRSAPCATGAQVFCVSGNPARQTSNASAPTSGFLVVDGLPTDAASQYSFQVVRP